MVQANDLGNPQLTSVETATVTIRVERNKNCPQIQGEPYVKVMDQTQGVNSEVMQIKAVDFDQQVIMLYLFN